MPAFVGGTGIAYPTPLTQMGFGIETAKGTLLAQPTYIIEVKAPKYTPDVLLIPDDTLQGSMVKVYDEIQSMRYDKHGWESYLYMDHFPILVCAEWGSTDTVTAAPTPGTLASTTVAGSNTISTSATAPVGSVVVFGTYPSLEAHVVTAVTGSGPYTLTLNYPVTFVVNSGQTVTGLTAHKFSLLNTATGQPPSLSIWDYDGEEWRTLTAMQLDELVLKGNNTGLADYTTTVMGNPATPNASAPSTSLTAVESTVPWSLQCVIGGSHIVTVVDWELSFKRNTKPIPALTGQQAYFEYFADAIVTSGKFTFVEQSGSPYLTSYINATKQALDLTLYDPAGNLFNYHCTSAIFTTGELVRSKEWVEVTVDVQFLPTATDATAGGKSPGQIICGNTVTTAYH